MLSVELRDCACGTTLGLEVATPEHVKKRAEVTP